MQSKMVIFLFVFILLASSISAQTITKDYQTTSLGGKRVIVDIDDKYPVQVLDGGRLRILAISAKSISDLDKSYDTSKGIPIKDYRHPIYDINNPDLNSIIDYKTVYYNPAKDSYFDLDLSQDGVYHIGFTSTVITISDFSIAANISNIVAKSNGIIIENVHTNLTDNMLLYWQFNPAETTSGLVPDSAGNGNYGNISGGSLNYSWYQSIGTGQRIRMTNATNGYLNHLGTKGTFNTTFCVWGLNVKAQAFGTLISKNSGQLGFQLEVRNSSTSPMTFRCTVGNDSTHSNIAQYANSVDNFALWHMPCCVVNYTHVLYYLDGKYMNSSPMFPAGFNTAGYNLSSVNFVTTYDYNGSIDEVMVWNATLSVHNISSIYNASLFKFNQQGIAVMDFDFNRTQKWENLTFTMIGNTTNQNITINVSSSMDNITYTGNVSCSNSSFCNISTLEAGNYSRLYAYLITNNGTLPVILTGISMGSNDTTIIPKPSVFFITPNSTETYLNRAYYSISWNLSNLGSPGNQTLYLIWPNNYSQLLYNNSLTADASYTYMWNIKNIPPGNYTLNITVDDDTADTSNVTEMLSIVPLAGDDETMLGFLILIPLLLSFILLAGAATLDGEEHPVLKIGLFLFSIIPFFLSLHWGTIILIRYYDAAPLIDAIGEGTWSVGIIFFIVIVYFLIYAFYKGTHMVAQKEEEKLQY